MLLMLQNNYCIHYLYVRHTFSNTIRSNCSTISKLINLQLHPQVVQSFYATCRICYMFYTKIFFKKPNS